MNQHFSNSTLRLDSSICFSVFCTPCAAIIPRVTPVYSTLASPSCLGANH